MLILLPIVRIYMPAPILRALRKFREIKRIAIPSNDGKCGK
jgi:hypothetical protein